MKIGMTTALQRDDPARVLSWDSEFWGIRVAHADHPDVDQWALDNTVGLVQMLIDTDDIERLHDALERGFKVMDVRIELHRPTSHYPAYGLRTASELDRLELARIASEAHRITRFYADPNLPNESCDELYEKWITNSLDGWAQKVLVPTDVSGYVTIHVAGKSASIGLIAVDETRRRVGLGSTLCHGAIGYAKNAGATDIKVVTQARNTPAIRLFTRCGFHVRRTSYWLHKWYADGGKPKGWARYL